MQVCEAALICWSTCQLRIPKTRGPTVSFITGGSAFVRGNKQVNCSFLHASCFSFPVLVTLLSFTLISPAQCLQQWQLVQCEHTSYGCLTPSHWSSVISDCLLKGWARLAPSPSCPWPAFSCAASPSPSQPAALMVKVLRSPSSLTAASRCSQICTHLRRSWPSGLRRDGAYPSSTGVVSLFFGDFYILFGVLRPTWAHQFFCRALPGRPCAMASSSIAPFGARCGYFSAATSVSLSCFVRDWALRDVVSWDVEFCSRLSSRFVLFSSSFKHEAV